MSTTEDTTDVGGGPHFENQPLPEPQETEEDEDPESEEERLRREFEETVERLLLAEEEEGGGRATTGEAAAENAAAAARGGAAVAGGDAAAAQQEALVDGNVPLQAQQQQEGDGVAAAAGAGVVGWLPRTAGMGRTGGLSYTQASLMAAVATIYYALRTRHQWYLAVVYLGSSKWAFCVLGNACIAAAVQVFDKTVRVFLAGGLRVQEAEGLQDFFRWNITETCLALTMFRNELTVSTALEFLVLVTVKCLHHVTVSREQHLRMTEEAVAPFKLSVFSSSSSLTIPITPWHQVKVIVLMMLLQIADLWAVQRTCLDILSRGPTVSILFAFEAAILLVSASSHLLLWNLHWTDGLLNYWHEQAQQRQQSQPQENVGAETAPAGEDETRTAAAQPPPPVIPQLTGWNYIFVHYIYHPWKEHKATMTFAVELQAQAVQFLFYLVFFAIVLTYYGMPINLFREVYISFAALKERLLSFLKYRQLMASMNRFANATEELLHESGRVCIICRDEMTTADCKQLPVCQHLFHKSCLREWLVQQQSCPTCRSDIAAMEAQQAARNAATARAAAAAMVVPPMNLAPAAGAGATTPHTAAASTAAAPAAMEAEEDSKPHAVDLREERRDKKVRFVKDVPLVEQQQQPPPPLQAAAADWLSFPALYQVVREDGAPVWNYLGEDGNPLPWSEMTRIVPQGVIVLCQTVLQQQQQQQASNEHPPPYPIFWLKIPDGWIPEESAMRVYSFPQQPKQPPAASVPNENAT